MCLSILVPRTCGLLVCLLALLPACGGGGAPAVDEPYPQTLTAVMPEVGTTVGGTRITLKGTGFLDDVRRIRRIRFGEEIATTWEIVDDETIVVDSPPGLVGATVINLVGDNAPRQDGILLAKGFTYLAALLYVAEGPDAVQPRLLTVDLETGALGFVGLIGFAIAGMAMGADGMLYAAEAVPPYRLIRINPLSAVGDPYALLRDVDTDLPVQILDLAFVDGRLLGRSLANELVEIDQVLGKVSVLADLSGTLPAGSGLTVAGPQSVFLAPTGLAPRLDVHDVLTGTTLPGALFTAPADLEALAAQGGFVYGVSGAAAVGGAIDLLRIDPVTGEVLVATTVPEAVCAVARDL